MSSILKLRILGIRAFDNHEAQELEFSSPLTLICGPNGVGKTTVIECLRYVTTGDLPPNAKGGAFVHDPRMASEGEVKSQVKLLFNDSGGHRMVAARNMRLSVTGRGTSTFKTLEGYIKVQDKAKGNTGSISSRCADLNVHIPMALGVPPAILNYVVFCHQEDSLWPLAEPSIVKRRFDEIFEATKYTKALESLKVIRKEYMTNIKVEKVQVDHLRADKDRVQEKHVLLADLQTRTDELHTECDELQHQRMNKSDELNAVVEHSQRTQQLAYAAKNIEQQRARTLKDIEILGSEIRELLDSMSSEALSEELSQSDERESQLDAEISETRNRRAVMQSNLDQLQEKLAVLANQQGRIEQLQEEHNGRIKRREEMADGVISLEEWKEARDAELTDLNEEIEDIELRHRQQEEELSQSVSSVEARKLQLRQNVTNSRNSLRNSENQAAEIQQKISELNKASMDEEGLQLIQARQTEIDAEHNEAQTRLTEFESKDFVVSATKNVREVEEKAEKSRTAVQEAIDASSAQARLQFLRDSQRETRSRLDSCIKKLESALEKEGHSVNSDTESPETFAVNLLKNLGETQSQRSRDLADIKLQLQTSKKALSENESKLKKLELLKSNHLSKLADPALVDTYDERVQEAENALLTATEEQEQLQFAHSFFAKALSLAQNESNPSCLLCDHHKSPPEAQALASKLIAKISALNISPDEAEAETETKRNELEHLRSQKPLIDKAKQAISEIMAVSQEITARRESVTALESNETEVQQSLSSAETQFNKMNSLLGTMLHQVGRNRDESLDLSKKLDMESSISQVSTVTKTPQEAQQNMEQVEIELKAARNELDRQRAEHDRLKTRVSQLSHSAQELKLRLSDFELKSARRKQAEDQLEKLTEQQHKLQSDLSEAQHAIPEVESTIEQMQRQLRTKKHEHAQIERKYAEQRSSLVNTLKAFNDLTNDIASFERAHGNDPLAQLREKSEAIRTSMQELVADITALDERINELEKQRTDFGSYRRNLNDNLRIRSLQSELVTITSEHERAVAELEKAQNEIGEDYEQHIRSLQVAVGELNHSISTKTGESKALNEQMQQIRHELATTYRETAEHYRRAVVKLETSEGAAEDLVKYVKALDGAIMQYHSLKMAEINSLLDEMWKRTYTGTDIDTILIKSESDVGSASTRASYNYRVCMVKQETELDMRGRCSAGQKVLASILIRMALAECFGNSSGLIVLDEPTTNLDRENIEALAQSLSDIIASRRAQHNFQLIVITHDEHFLAQMNPANYCSYYYRIARDSRQLSTVHKMPITSLN